MADYDSSLPVRTELNNSSSDGQFSIADGTTATQLWNIDANGVGQVNLNDGTNSLVINSDGTIGIGDGTEQLLVNTDGSISTQITDGTETMAVNTDGSINVNIIDAVTGAVVHEYATTASVAAGATTTVLTYTVTAATTLFLQAFQASGSAKWKAELKAGTPAAETTRAVMFGSTSMGNQEHTLPTPIEVAAGDNVLVVMTNRDNQAQDLYAFINGHEA